MKRSITLCLVLLAAYFQSFGQWEQKKHHTQSGNGNRYEIKLPEVSVPASNEAAAYLFNPSLDNLRPVNYSLKGSPLKITAKDAKGKPVFVKGVLPNSSSRGLSANIDDYLTTLAPSMSIKEPKEEFRTSATFTDQEGYNHIRMGQYYKGVKIWGSEIILHEKNNVVEMMNGRYAATPVNMDITPAITSDNALVTAKHDVAQINEINNLSSKELMLIGGKQFDSELVIYKKNLDDDQSSLAWHIVIVPNLRARWEYFVDAKSGEIIEKHSLLCGLKGFDLDRAISYHDHTGCDGDMVHTSEKLLDGPATATALDLKNINRNINTYNVGSSYYLIDAGKSMFNAGKSTMPDNPVGTIITLDGKNNSPENSNFDAFFITSNNNQWSSKTAVSAHYNAGETFNFYKNTFGRNSINDQGGNIISIINVNEKNGASMDNAFWNGNAMFYGNGDVAFTPLAKSLDVASHEMTHGVIQNTADLVYQNESGAINESMADVFGILAGNPTGWKLGTEVVKTSYFPSGALRDMSNPHNGGSSLSDPGWQPRHVSEKYAGTQDNGGVHINSGIPNWAFYKFATAIGRDKAQKVYYKTLTSYLNKSSQFIDLRRAVIQAATDFYGASSAEVNAAKTAFDEVGITDGGGGGTTQPGDLKVNPGQDYIVAADDANGQLYLCTTAGTVLGQISVVGASSKPSIMDDGSVLVYTGTDKRLYQININTASPSSSQNFVLNNEQVWKNVIIAKNKLRIAAIADDDEPYIYVSDQKGGAKTFELFNPTSSGGSTNNVKYADAMEFDHSGEFIIYDAYNTIGTGFDYWDIGLLKVWNNSTDSYGDGFIQKVFQSLPENASVGNPSFSKNSPYIFAMDYLDDQSNIIYGVNLYDGNIGEIYDNTVLGYPDYSKLDNQMLFNAEDNSGRAIVAIINLAANKIEAASNPNPLIMFTDAKLGVWFSTGTRQLVNTNDVQEAKPVSIYPNPVSSTTHIKANFDAYGKAEVQIFDALGKSVYFSTRQVSEGEQNLELNLSGLNTGTYYLRMIAGKNIYRSVIVKQ